MTARFDGVSVLARKSEIRSGKQTWQAALAASSSVIALATVFGSEKAQAFEECGVPGASPAIVNCTATNFPTGIDYGDTGIDDLTVNVGSFAGTTAPVTVTGDIVVFTNTSPAANDTQVLNVGSNVTVTSSSYAEEVFANNVGNYTSTAAITNGAAVTAGAGALYSGASSIDGTRNTAYASVINTGALSTSGTGPFSQDIFITSYAESLGSTTAYATAHSYGSNTGALSTTGLDEDAIVAKSEAVAIMGVSYSASFTEATTSSYVINSGAITTSGTESVGIFARSESYSGIKSSGHAAPDESANATADAYTTVLNSGAITTTGADEADGIYAGSFARSKASDNAASLAATYVSNSGAVKVSGDAAVGLEAVSKADAYGAYASATSTTKIVNTGAISTTLNASYVDARGLSAVSIALVAETADGVASASATVDNSGIISTGSIDSPGIGANATAFGVEGDYASGYASATITNSAGIYTHGADSDGLFAFAEAISEDVEVASAGTNVTVNNSGRLYTVATDSDGMFVKSYGYGRGDFESTVTSLATVTNSGNIYTTGTDSLGIYVETKASSEAEEAYATAVTTLYNSGAITTATNNSSAIIALTYAQGFSLYGGTSTATATISNSGVITTSGDGALGIGALTKARSYAEFGYSNNPAVAFTEAYATAAITNSGTITTSGEDADGIEAITYAETRGGYASTAAATLSITNSGSITTSGVGASGIDAPSIAGAEDAYNAAATATTTVTNSGSITTSGLDAVGISVSANAETSEAAYATATATTTVTNSGSITTSGLDSVGISVSSDATAIDAGYASATATTTVTNSGSITTSGKYAHGIEASSFANSTEATTTSATATTNATNSGMITTTGYRADGINADSEAEASFTTFGYATAITNVTNTGTINVSGKYADGIVATASVSGEHYVGAVLVTNSGHITASGYDSQGVYARADYVNVTNKSGGVIDGGWGKYGAGINVYSAYDLAIDNAGTITSENAQAIYIGKDVDNALIYNQLTGTITGFITAHGYNQTFDNAGTWIALGGNSDFTPQTGGSSILVNTGTVLFVGDQKIIGLDAFENSGLVALDAVHANQGARPQFETVEITGDFVGEGGTVQVGSNMTTTADVLKVDGAISGTDFLKVVPEGAPGLTTGNGILVVDASTGTTAASNFKIFSNDSAGTFVDGAYQFSLGLVPGAGSSGQWFLTSKPFNGVYQLGQASSAGLMTFELTTLDLPDLIEIEQTAPGETASNQQPVQVASNDNNFVPTANGPGQAGLGGWGRYNYASLNVTPEGNSASNFHLRAEIGHLGVDHTIFGPDGQRFIIGFTAGPVSSEAKFDSFGTRLDTNGFYLGGYGVWLDGPWTAGVMVNMARLDTHITDTFIDTDARLRPDSRGIQAAASYQLDLDSGYTIEPWAQLSYASADGGTFINGVGNLFGVDATNAGNAQFGARLLTTITSGQTVFRPYATASLDYLFDTQSNFYTQGFAASTDINGITGHFGGGLNVNLTDRFALFGEANYLAGQRQTGWTGFVGLRYAQ